MSEQAQGAGWWQASDGKWYPPETVPSVPGVPRPDAGRGGGLAVTGFVFGLIGMLGALTPFLFVVAWGAGLFGFVFGLIARARIDPNGDRRGMATAAVILGLLAVLLGFGQLWLINDFFD